MKPVHNTFKHIGDSPRHPYGWQAMGWLDLKPLPEPSFNPALSKAFGVLVAYTPPIWRFFQNTAIIGTTLRNTVNNIFWNTL